MFDPMLDPAYGSSESAEGPAPEQSTITYKGKEYPFYGYDWQELAEYFGIELPEDEPGEYESYKVLTKWLESNSLNEDGTPNIAVVDACKAYTSALIRANKDHSFDTPIWKGLLEVGENNNETFMQFIVILLPLMWD